MDDKFAALKIINTENIGNRKFKLLIDNFGSPSAVLNSDTENLITTEGINKNLAKNLLSDKNNKIVEDIYKKSEDVESDIVYYGRSDYPENLSALYDPPAVLFVKNKFIPEDINSIGIVGSRFASKYGKKMSEYFSAELCRYGITIVSGFAMGIDTVAHHTTLKNNGRTIAVLGSGIDVIYPYENKELYSKIIENNGTIVSEFVPGTKPDAPNFPYRNRIISGLSKGILVIQAGKKSGALITARLAIEQGRDVFAIPNRIDIKGSEGSNNLIKQGAQLVQDIDDIMSGIKFNVDLLKKQSKKAIAKNYVLSKLENKIFKVMDETPKNIDTIAKTANLTIHNTAAVLTQLELKKIIKQLPGKLFVKT